MKRCINLEFNIKTIKVLIVMTTIFLVNCKKDDSDTASKTATPPEPVIDTPASLPTNQKYSVNSEESIEINLPYTDAQSDLAVGCGISTEGFEISNSCKCDVLGACKVTLKALLKYGRTSGFSYKINTKGIWSAWQFVTLEVKPKFGIWANWSGFWQPTNGSQADLVEIREYLNNEGSYDADALGVNFKAATGVDSILFSAEKMNEIWGKYRSVLKQSEPNLASAQFNFKEGTQDYSISAVLKLIDQNTLQISFPNHPLLNRTYNRLDSTTGSNIFNENVATKLLAYKDKEYSSADTTNCKLDNLSPLSSVRGYAERNDLTCLKFVLDRIDKTQLIYLSLTKIIKSRDLSALIMLEKFGADIYTNSALEEVWTLGGYSEGCMTYFEINKTRCVTNSKLDILFFRYYAENMPADKINQRIAFTFNQTPLLKMAYHQPHADAYTILTLLDRGADATILDNTEGISGHALLHLINESSGSGLYNQYLKVHNFDRLYIVQTMLKQDFSNSPNINRNTLIQALEFGDLELVKTLRAKSGFYMSDNDMAGTASSKLTALEKDLGLYSYNALGTRNKLAQIERLLEIINYYYK